LMAMRRSREITLSSSALKFLQQNGVRITVIKRP
jgi:hypothetical protein